MSTAETSRRFRHIGLISQQRRLRHLRSLSARNISGATSPWGSAPSAPESLMETFFTLHVSRESDAFYTSEKIQDSLNPTWRSFDLCRSCPEVNTSRSLFFVKVWGGHDSDFKLIIEWKVDLKGLHFVGSKIHKDGVKYQPNSIIFGMFEGFYSSADNLQESTRNKSRFCKSIEVDQNAAISTYNTYSLARLHTTQRAIRQTEVSVGKVRSSIIQKLSDTSDRTRLCSEKEAVELRLLLLREEIKCQRRRQEKEKEESAQRRVQVEQAVEKQRVRWEEFALATKEMEELRNRVSEQKDSERQASSLYLGRKATLVRELSNIYPITQLPSNAFAICSALLPHAESNIQMGKDDPTISTALGHTSHLIVMISRFLQTPLRYPILYNGSRSTIHDHITEPLADKDRDFPLYTRGREKFHFNYGVYLLNRNIAQLRFALGLPTADLRLTLPNLQGLMEIKWGIASNVTQPSAPAGAQPVSGGSRPVKTSSPQSCTSVGIQASMAAPYMSPNPPNYSSAPGIAVAVAMDRIPNSPPPAYHISQAAQEQGRGVQEAVPPAGGEPAAQPSPVRETELEVPVDEGNLRDSGVVTEGEEASGGVGRGETAEGDASERGDADIARTSESGSVTNGANSAEEDHESEGEEGQGSEDIGIGQPNYQSGDALSQDSLDVDNGHIGQEMDSNGQLVADRSSVGTPHVNTKGEVVEDTCAKTNNVGGETNNVSSPHNQSNSNSACRGSQGEGATVTEHSMPDSAADYQGSKVKGHELESSEPLPDEREVPFMAVDHIFCFDDIGSRANALSNPSGISSFKSSVSANKTRNLSNS